MKRNQKTNTPLPIFFSSRSIYQPNIILFKSRFYNSAAQKRNKPSKTDSAFIGSRKYLRGPMKVLASADESTFIKRPQNFAFFCRPDSCISLLRFVSSQSPQTCVNSATLIFWFHLPPGKDIFDGRQIHVWRAPNDYLTSGFSPNGSTQLPEALDCHSPMSRVTVPNDPGDSSKQLGFLFLSYVIWQFSLGQTELFVISCDLQAKTEPAMYWRNIQR